MKNNIPEVHHHHSLRLQGYDYSGEGLYFITICTKNRLHLFAKISKGEMIHDEIGITAEMMFNDIRKFAGDGEIMVDGIMPDMGLCHGMAPRAKDDRTVDFRRFSQKFFFNPSFAQICAVICANLRVLLLLSDLMFPVFIGRKHGFYQKKGFVYQPKKNYKP